MAVFNDTSKAWLFRSSGGPITGVILPNSDKMRSAREIDEKIEKVGRCIKVFKNSLKNTSGENDISKRSITELNRRIDSCSIKLKILKEVKSVIEKLDTQVSDSSPAPLRASLPDEVSDDEAESNAENPFKELLESEGLYSPVSRSSKKGGTPAQSPLKARISVPIVQQPAVCERIKETILGAIAAPADLLLDSGMLRNYPTVEYVAAHALAQANLLLAIYTVARGVPVVSWRRF